MTLPFRKLPWLVTAVAAASTPGLPVPGESPAVGSPQLQPLAPEEWPALVIERSDELRLDAHEALATLAIDAHELWAPAEADHHHE